MFQHKIAFCITFACLILSAQATAQQVTPKEMTNADVIKMVKAGLPDSTITAAIQQSPTNFDISTDALIELKNQGVSSAVMGAMLQTKNKKESPTPTTPANTDMSILAAMAQRPGVKLIDGTNTIDLKYTMASSRAGGMIVTKVQSTLKGNHALLRITNTSPVFEIAVPSSYQPADYITLAKLDAKSDRRELQMGKSTFSGFKIEIPIDKLVPITLEESPSQNNSASGYFKIYRVKLVNPIPPGEYAVVLGGIFYDFGVDASK
ncbi:MAG: hypothetical protein ACKVQJ_09945 [Pyrinomonadaceae bacterium]